MKTPTALTELQLTFTEFVNVIMQEQTLIAAVDGKTAKQIKDDSNLIHMLNVFTQRPLIKAIQEYHRDDLV